MLTKEQIETISKKYIKCCGSHWENEDAIPEYLVEYYAPAIPKESIEDFVKDIEKKIKTIAQKNPVTWNEGEDYRSCKNENDAPLCANGPWEKYSYKAYLRLKDEKGRVWIKNGKTDNYSCAYLTAYRTGVGWRVDGTNDILFWYPEYIARINL